jgi:hypothetical protein
MTTSFSREQRANALGLILFRLEGDSNMTRRSELQPEKQLSAITSMTWEITIDGCDPKYRTIVIPL